MREICESESSSEYRGPFEVRFGSVSLSWRDIIGSVWYNICELDVKDQSDISPCGISQPPPGLQIEVNLYSCHLHLSPPFLLLLLLWTLPAREFLLKAHSATQVGQSALAVGSKSFILWLGGVRKVITLLRESSGAALGGLGNAAPASPPDRRPPKPECCISFLQIVIKRE